MAGVPDKALVSIKGWPIGINNVAQEVDSPVGSLREAMDVDIDNAGKVSSKDGYTLIQAIPGLHSLWYDKRYPYVLGVFNGNLVLFDTSMNQISSHALISGTRYMSYEYAVGFVLFTNGIDSGQIRDDGSVMAWATESPSGQPLISEEMGVGGLDAGKYQVAATFIDINGRESGSTLAVEIDIAAGNGIRMSSIPQPVSSDIAYIRIYATTANGDTLSYFDDLFPGTLTHLIVSHAPGRPLETQFLQPLPPGQIVRCKNGIQFVCADKYLYWSEPLRYGLGRLTQNYIRFDSKITMFAPVGDAGGTGYYLVAGPRTYYMAGNDPKRDWQKVIAYVHGATERSSINIDAKILRFETTGEIPVWYSSEGQWVAGLKDATVIELHADQYIGREEAESAAVVVRKHKGIHQLMSSIKGGVASGFMAGDSVVAEVYKNGIRIS